MVRLFVCQPCDDVYFTVKRPVDGASVSYLEKP